MNDHRAVAVVTGANGFLARNLIPSLVDEGWRVIGVSREKGPDRASETLSWEEFWSGDSIDPNQIKALFHLAAFIPPNLEDSIHAAACVNTNALLTLKLAEHVATHSKARFIHCSSGQVYPYQTQPATEEDDVLPMHRACFYLASKLLGEIYVERTRKVLGLDAITFRVGSCYGPWMPKTSLVAYFVSLASKGQRLPLRHGGRQQSDLVYAPDVVQYLLRAAKSNKQGIFNAGSGKAVTTREMAETVNRVFGSQAGLVEEEPCTAAFHPGFAPLSMTRTAAFGWKPRTLSEGLENLRSWLENRPAG